MIITCKKCGKTAQGQYYKFHYGEVLNTQSGSRDILLSRYTWIKANYKILGEAGADICNRCATTKIGFTATLALLIMTVLYAILFTTMARAGLLPMKIGWQAILFLVCPLVFLVFPTILGILELFDKGLALANNDVGEKAAIEVRKKDLGIGHHSTMMAFWTSKEYKKLIQEQIS